MIENTLLWPFLWLTTQLYNIYLNKVHVVLADFNMNSMEDVFLTHCMTNNISVIVSTAFL